MRIKFKNQLDISIQLSCGMEEYNLNPEQEVVLTVQDGDCMYIDTLNKKSANKAKTNLDSLLVSKTHEYLKLVPCIKRVKYESYCVECNDVCEWYKTIVNVAEIIKMKGIN